MDFQKIYARIRDIDQGKQTINESMVECGQMPAPVAPPAAPPVTMSVNFNAQGIDHIKELLGLMQSAESPLAAGPVGGKPAIEPMSMPTPGMPAGAPSTDVEPAKTPDINDLDSLVKLAGVPAAPKKEIGDETGDDMSSDEEQAEPGTGDMMQDIAGEIKDMADELSGDEGNDDEEETDESGEWDEYTGGNPMPDSDDLDTYSGEHDPDEETDEGAYDASTTPNPGYQDTNYMIKDLAGGLNKEKKMFKHSYKQGDNPMAMESVKQDLVQRYRELKGK